MLVTHGDHCRAPGITFFMVLPGPSQSWMVGDFRNGWESLKSPNKAKGSPL